MAQESEKVVKDRIKRMKWWSEARFGMFIHWGLYSQIARGEWVMNRERIPIPEYEKYADSWKVKNNPAREWARLAKQAGMKYMVLTTKHHEGFSLWESKVNPYNSVNLGPKRDLVKEFVAACREFGLKVGFYYSLMDWHHPDGHSCKTDEASRRRFVDYTYGLVKELMSNYGKVDILWYDVSFPLSGADKWESPRINAMARKLQPHILINDRSQMPEDFGTPEEHISAMSDEGGRGWEACMTFNGSWGWQESPPEEWHSTRKVLDMLRTCATGGGNLLLNIGPLPDGTVPDLAIERLSQTGEWLKTYGEAIYGKVDRFGSMEPNNNCTWSRKGKTLYAWVTRWPGETFTLGGVRGKLKAASLVCNGKKLAFTQEKDRLTLTGLPKTCPDKVAGVSLIKMDFATVPYTQLGYGYEYLPPAHELGKEQSDLVGGWFASQAQNVKGGLAKASTVKADYKKWLKIAVDNTGFINLHNHINDRNGIIYLAKRFKVAQTDEWVLHLGHDGGAALFLDGKKLTCDPECKNPAEPFRSKATAKLSKGEHEVMIAFDLADGKGWGIFFHWEKVHKKAKYPAAL